MSEEKLPNIAAKNGILMVGGFAGALILFVLQALPGFFAIITGLVLLFFGYGILSSKKTKDTLAGLACTIAGSLTILSKIPFIKHPAGWLLKAGAIILLIMGVWNGIKFVMSIKNRP